MKERIKDALSRRRARRQTHLDALSAALMRSRHKRQQVIDAALNRAGAEARAIAASSRRGRTSRWCRSCARYHSKARGCDLVHIRDVAMRNGETRRHWRVRGAI